MADRTKRSCNGCTLCCKTHGTKDEALGLDKPDGVWCMYCVQSSGCSVYQKKPLECGTYDCSWKRGSGGENEWPHLVRIVSDSYTIEIGGQKLNVYSMRGEDEQALVSAYAKAKTAQLVRAGWVVEYWNKIPARSRYFLPKGVPEAMVPAIRATLDNIGHHKEVAAG